MHNDSLRPFSLERLRPSPTGNKPIQTCEQILQMAYTGCFKSLCPFLEDCITYFHILEVTFLE